jgi:hypothetical protein
MGKIEKRVKQRNWVAKNDFNRAVTMAVKTRYRRKDKHQHRMADQEIDREHEKESV